MPQYRLIYQDPQGQSLTLDVTARRPCDARDEGRNAMNARGLDPVLWPLIRQSLVEST